MTKVELIQSLLDAGDLILMFDSRRAAFPRVDLLACVRGFQGMVVGGESFAAVLERPGELPFLVDIPWDAIYAVEDCHGEVTVFRKDVPPDHPLIPSKPKTQLKVC